MNAWSQLPNAALIDWVLQDVATHPDGWSRFRNYVWGSAWEATLNSINTTPRTAILDAAWDYIWQVTHDPYRSAARSVPWGVISALIAWDDCQEVLDLPMDAFRFMVEMGDRRAVLLHSLKLVKESS